MSKQKSVYVYHEIQASGLCGVHCLNTLFQNPVFNEVILGNIGQELDDRERQLMFEHGGATKEFLQYMSEDSGNVSDSGNFSVQVLQRALDSQNLDCTLLTQTNWPQVFSTLHKQNAFICNRGEHWYTIRKIEDEWYNLNSLLQAPRFIPELILADEFQSLVRDGHTIYLINGKLPPVPVDRRCSADGKWIRVKGTDEDDLAVALELSMKMNESNTASTNSNARTSISTPSTSSNSYYSNQSGHSLYPQPTQSTPTSLSTSTLTVHSQPYSFSSEHSSHGNISYPSISNAVTSSNNSISYPQPHLSSSSSSSSSQLSINNSNNKKTNNPQSEIQKILSEPIINTANQDLSYDQQSVLMHQYFGKCLSTMERLNSRLINLEATIQKIQSTQRN